MQIVTEDAKERLVSVIIPTYNRSWSLGKAVRSIFAQSYRPIECIVVDDGSTDDTHSVIENLIAESPKGIVLRPLFQPNSGANAARNKGLALCLGQFICYLDSDDWLLPDSIETRARVLLQKPEIDLCYGLCSSRNDSNQEEKLMNSPWPPLGAARIARYLFDTNSPMIRRAICAKAGLWREDIRGAQEFEYFSRVKYFSNDAIFVDRVMSVYRRHNKGSIFQPTKTFACSLLRGLYAVKSLITASRYDIECERRELALGFKIVATRFSQLHDWAYAQQALLESLMLHMRARTLAQLATTMIAKSLHRTSRIVRSSATPTNDRQ